MPNSCRSRNQKSSKAVNLNKFVFHLFLLSQERKPGNETRYRFILLSPLNSGMAQFEEVEWMARNSICRKAGEIENWINFLSSAAIKLIFISIKPPALKKFRFGFYLVGGRKKKEINQFSLSGLPGFQKWDGWLVCLNSAALFQFLLLLINLLNWNKRKKKIEAESNQSSHHSFQ